MTPSSLLRWSVGLPFTAWSLRQQLARKTTRLCAAENEIRRLEAENARLKAALAEPDWLAAKYMAPSAKGRGR